MALPIRRAYAGAAASCTLSSDISSSATSFSLTGTTSGYPTTTSGGFYMVIDPGLATEEKVYVGSRSSGSLSSVVRGVDGTTAASHTTGATCYPVFSAVDADEANKIASTLTTKGDLLVTDGSVHNRLGVGSNDQILVADSAATNGVKWATPAAAASTGLGYRSGKLYTSLGTKGNGSTPDTNTTYYAPFRVTETKTFDRISFSTTNNTITGTATCRLGIYNQSAGVPTTVLLDAGTVNVTAANTVYSVTINQSLTAGVYYLAFNMQTAFTSGFIVGVASDSNMYSYLNIATESLQSSAGASTAVGLQQSGVTGAFATAGAVSAQYFGPYMALRAA